MIERLHLNLRRKVDDSYDVLIGHGLLEHIPVDLKISPLGNKYAIITDSEIRDLYGRKLLENLEGEGIKACLIDFPAGEESKNLNTVGYLVRRLLEDRIDRKSAIIALGGGVVGDISGFTASIFMRGVPYIQVPTTLMAQVDSSIGGKTAVDTPNGKNIIGAFYQPKKVYIDPLLLKTLPEREFISGLAEVVKYGVIRDQSLFEYLEENRDKIRNREKDTLLHIIKVSCGIKKEIVEEDPKEENKRAILNYGHTPAHALERISGYKCLHGEAVSVGMKISGGISIKKGFWNEEEWNRQNRLLEYLGLPLKMDFKISIDNLIEAFYYDKKAEGGTIMFVLPRRIGEMALVDGKYKIPISESELRAFLRSMLW